MSDFKPQVPVQLQIRKIIFEKYNDTETRFTNDDVFAVMQQGKDVDPAWIIDDMEPFFSEICDKKLVRNIAQNFTTMWFMLFEPVEQVHCGSCGLDVHVGKAEERACPNPECGKKI